MKKYTDHHEEWGEFVDVKINIADRLRNQIKRSKPGVVMLGTVTDAYQPLEKNFRLTRLCLEILSDFDFPVFIQTKSDLILRDVDLLKRIKQKQIGFTITSPHPDVEKLFEPHASSLERRFEALIKLRENGIFPFVFFGPILPYFSDDVKSLKLLFKRLQEMKINKVYLDKMNYLKGKWRRIGPLLKQKSPQALSFYKGVIKHQERYTEWLRDNLCSVLSEFSFDVEVLF